MKKQQYGFTLVELSIVLVILGLLVGGVLTGQSLIRAAELRSISTEFHRYQTATNTFRDKYLALPGDMANAQSYWGIAPDCAVAATGTQTCNGNGNGHVGSMTDGTQFHESLRFWQHLANAGLIEGSYTGVGTTETTRLNSPTAKLNSSTLWAVNDYGTLLNLPIAFDGEYGQGINLGTFAPGTLGAGTVLNAEDLYNLDMKMDDGKPATGRMVAAGALTTCTTASGNSDLTGAYRLTDKSVVCAPIFRQAF